MRNQYDFETADTNPYSKRMKKQVTLRLDVDALDYFKQLAEETGLPYQTLINLYLGDCAKSRRRPSLRWRPK